MQTRVRPLNYFRETWASSVVRINGTFTTVRSPNVETLTAAGVEGADYFIGGHIYKVSDATSLELQSAGYALGINGYGYGYGLYGAGIYGG